MRSIDRTLGEFWDRQLGQRRNQSRGGVDLGRRRVVDQEREFRPSGTELDGGGRLQSYFGDLFSVHECAVCAVEIEDCVDAGFFADLEMMQRDSSRVSDDDIVIRG